MENHTQKPRALLFWIHPRQVIRQLIDTKPTSYIVPFAILHGLIAGLYWMSTVYLYLPLLPIFAIMLLSLVGGAIIGVIQLYVMGWLYRICGRWLGGTGTYQDLKCAVGWSFYPFIVVGCLGILSAITFPHPWIQSLFGCLSLVGFVWGLVILFRIVAEAHHFASAWRGLVTVVIALLLVLGVFFILGLLEALVQ